MRVDRLNDMEEYVLKCGSVSLEDLAEHFQISLNTVRRDLDELVDHGKIKKVYGGVMSTAIENISVTNREKINTNAKQVIGSLAAQLIKNDSTVFIDSGTTTAQVIPYLSNKTNVTIITNSLKVMYETSKYANLNLLALGGYFSNSRSSFVGASTIESMSKLNFDLVLIGATCVSLRNGLSLNSFFEVDIKQWVTRHNKNRIVLLADSEKYDKAALYSFCDFDEVNYVVAERVLPEPYMERIAENGMKFICPDV